ncbi:MAG: helix-turn-helix transcriptional regulator [bacterium]|nr:helix-turn-helix transcriptional regulator [bacterium]
MTSIDHLLENDLDTASTIAAGILPDVVAALDLLVPQLAAGADRAALRRYYIAVDAAAQTLAALPTSNPEAHVPPAVVHRLLLRDIAELAWVAPSADGTGVLTAMVDRIRGLAGGVPQQCVKARADIDEHRFVWFLESMIDLEFEQRCGSPLKRAMKTLELSSTDMARLMGVTRQAVDKWLAGAPPIERMAKIGAIAEISDMLRHRLRDGMPPVVARRRAEAYGGRTMLQVIAEDDHEWLRRSVRDSFDYAAVA